MHEASESRMQSLSAEQRIGAVTQCSVIVGSGGADALRRIIHPSPRIDEALAQHGAVLFRGFGITSPEDFRSVAEALTVDLAADSHEHEPVSSDGVVQTPVFYAPHQKLLWHNENSFNLEWPLRIFFACVESAEQGGETPLVDSRAVLERIDRNVVERFRNHGVMYVRNYTRGLGLGWETVFGTSDRLAIEERCRSEAVEFEWRSASDLRTTFVRPAIVRHPRTGDESWFNQIQHWHPSCLDVETREALFDIFEEDELPRNCFFGDGSAIDDSVVGEILRVYGELETAFRWEPGDFLAVDNVLTAHGRNPYVGSRRLLVALGDMHSFVP